MTDDMAYMIIRTITDAGVRVSRPVTGILYPAFFMAEDDLTRAYSDGSHGDEYSILSIPTWLLDHLEAAE